MYGECIFQSICYVRNVKLILNRSGHYKKTNFSNKKNSSGILEESPTKLRRNVIWRKLSKIPKEFLTEIKYLTSVKNPSEIFGRLPTKTNFFDIHYKYVENENQEKIDFHHEFLTCT